MRDSKPSPILNPSRLLQVFDKITGVFVDLFDPRLLLPAVTALFAYAIFFTHRKFPGRWMEYVALGLVLVAFVALTARTPGFVFRVHWHKGMAALWFALHLCMLVSGFFNEDWLPDATALLLAYPFLFAIISARDDTSTLYAVTRGVVLAAMPFLLWSFAAVPLVFNLSLGYAGVFFNQNGLAMCSGLMSVCALLLCYADWQQGRRGLAAMYAAVSVIGALAILLSASRSVAVAYLGVLLLLTSCVLLRRARRPWLVITGMLCVSIAAAGVMGYVTWQKIYRNAEEDYGWSLYINETTDLGLDPHALPPDERVFTLDDVSSMRVSLWRSALTNLTWNGHPQGYIKEWMEKQNFEWLQRNAHNAFVQVAYSNGWPAGLLFAADVAISAYRAWLYYWRRRRVQVMAIAPLLITTLFILQGMFESIYSPFSPVCCAYLLIQGVLWRKTLAPLDAEANT
jgi:hypothetical protein